MGITTLTALALAQKLHAGELKINQALDAYYAAIEATNQNNFIILCKEQAYARAAEIQARLDAGDIRSPLAGVPMAADDLICTLGIETAAGSRALAGFIPPYDAAVIEKINAADMLLLGKTRVGEFGMADIETGAAAAVAAGETPLALACDTGGLLRKSAARCGVTALRPTYGAVSRFGVCAYASSMDQVGPIARDIAGCAALFDIIKGSDPRDGTTCGGASPLRCASDEACIGNMPSLDYALPVFEILACAEASSNLARFDGIKYGHASEKAQNLHETYVFSRSEGFGPEAKRRVMLGNLMLSAGQYEAYYVKAMRARRLIQEALFKALDDCDALSSPANDNSALVAASLAGLPALALPDGTQLIGKAFAEDMLLGIN